MSLLVRSVYAFGELILLFATRQTTMQKRNLNDNGILCQKETETVRINVFTVYFILLR